MLILEDLYLGDIRPSERSFKRNSQYAKALDDLVKAGDALTDTLTEKQKEMFEDYITAQREVNVLTDCETFIYGNRIGAHIGCFIQLAAADCNPSSCFNFCIIGIHRVAVTAFSWV